MSSSVNNPSGSKSLVSGQNVVYAGITWGIISFGGARFSQSWRMIAAAALSLYIADMWFKYSATLPVGYESGSLLEVFFVFSGVLFAIGAASEYDISSRSRRSNRRRTG